MRKLKSLFAVIMAMAMMFAMSSVALAANTDPNLSLYGNTQYTATVNDTTTAQTVVLQVVPASASYEASYFTTAAAAQAVTFTNVAGGNFTPVIGETKAVIVGRSQYAAEVSVTVPAGASGVVSILASNPAGGATATINMTIVADTTMPAAQNVTSVFYGEDGKELAKATGMTVASNDFYSTPNYNFPTAIDAVYQAWVKGIGQTNRLSQYVMDYGYVSSLTFVNGSDTITLAEKTVGSDYYGWQYRVYHNNQVVELSAVVGADNIALQDNDTIVWKYGAYGAVEFAPTL